MAKINSRAKGARAEREFARLLREHGYEAERGCQHAGGKDSPDVKSNMKGCHWEIKHVERLNVWDAMAQSKGDAGENEMPLVAHRKNHTEWLVTMPFTSWIELYRAWEESEDKTNE